MNIATVDVVVIVTYLVVVTAIGARLGGKLLSSQDYFLGGRTLPWWAVCLSVVATETSTLTFISIPGLAYISNLNFLQIALGYILGRIVVSIFFLPSYYRGELRTSYELLYKRFGPRVRTLSSVIFLITRLLADGVRLFATAIPLSIMTGWSLPLCISIIAVFTIIYTSIGGIRSVVWMDVLQTFIYVGGAIVAGFFILAHLPQGWTSVLEYPGMREKLQIFNLGFHLSAVDFFRTNYTLAASLLGGAFLSMASHGTDQIIVQRLLACRNAKDSKKALIASGFIVLFQFAIFLLLGLLLYAFYNGVTLPSDEILPKFIIEELPSGLSGLIIASVFAAAMSTLSSSLNSLASSTMFDLFLPHKTLNTAQELRLSRVFTIVWGLVFIGGAMVFQNKDNPVVELGLAIVSFTYGSVLGAFFLATFHSHIRESALLLSMLGTIFLMLWFIGPPFGMLVLLLGLVVLAGIFIFKSLEWRYRILQLALAVLGGLLLYLAPSPGVAWPWYVPVGTLLMLMLGTAMAWVQRP